jgi:hypothetical protein
MHDRPDHVCHAYQILKRGGLKAKNILLYDDIAKAHQNPRPGVIISAEGNTEPPLHGSDPVAAPSAEEEVTRWAVLVAGSSGYRLQVRLHRCSLFNDCFALKTEKWFWYMGTSALGHVEFCAASISCISSSICLHSDGTQTVYVVYISMYSSKREVFF